MRRVPRQTAKIRVESKRLSTTSEGFVCATLDWWPPSKCDSTKCAWGQTGKPVSLLMLNLSNPVLRATVKALVGSQVYVRRVRVSKSA
eukprot:3228985-Pyramimonas_sp.AAC.1